MDKDKHFIDPERLTPGIYIDLELSWTQHPFIFSKFKISTWDDVRQIQKLGLEKVRFFPHKSDTEINLDELVWQEEKTEPVKTDTLWEQKKISIDKAQKYRTERKKAASKYEETKHQISVLVTDLKTAPANAIRDASSVIDEMAVLFKNQQNMMINLVNLTGSSYSFHNHSLNVTVLAMLMGFNMDLSQDKLKLIGMGAMLHDIGKILLPQHIVNKAEKLTRPEQELLNTHTTKGLTLVSSLDNIPTDVLQIVARHHAYLDGSGFPKGLKPEEISTVCRIVAIANHYDNLCNPVNPKNSVTPKAAMSILFAKYQDKLDSQLIQLFIKTFGVYPPGTVVQLSDEDIGLVVAVDSKSLLSPQILVYNPDIPPDKALLLNMADHPKLKIIKALRAGEYSQRIYDYLGVQDRVGYFIDRMTRK